MFLWDNFEVIMDKPMFLKRTTQDFNFLFD